MGLINNPWNPKFHISFATFTWESNLKTLSTPLLKGEMFENDNFKTAYSISIKYLLVCIQNIATGKNTGSSNICTPWILSGKYNLLKDILYIFFQPQVFILMGYWDDC